MPIHHTAAEKGNRHTTLQVFGESGSRNGALQALSPGNGSADIEMMAKCSGRSGNQTVPGLHVQLSLETDTQPARSALQFATLLISLLNSSLFLKACILFAASGAVIVMLM